MYVLLYIFLHPQDQLYFTSQELGTQYAFCPVLIVWFTPIFQGLFHWQWGNVMITSVPVKQPWRI